MVLSEPKNNNLDYKNWVQEDSKITGPGYSPGEIHWLISEVANQRSKSRKLHKRNFSEDSDPQLHSAELPMKK